MMRLWGGILDDLRTLNWANIHQELGIFPAVAQRLLS